MPNQPPLLLTRRQTRLVQNLIDHWQKTGLLEPSHAESLNASFRQSGMDWRRLSFWAVTFGVICLGYALYTAFEIDWVERLISLLWNAPEQLQFAFFAVLAAGLYLYGFRRWQTHPANIHTNQGYLLGGVLSTAAAIALLPVAFNLKGDDASSLLLLGAAIYGATAFLGRSRLIWVFAILTLGGWMGARTGYVSGWGAYWLGMNYPLRFMLFGLAMTGVSYILPYYARSAFLALPTRTMGFLYLFLALWIMSIFGNYGDMDEWEAVKQIELFHWSLLFGLAGAGALWLGLRFDDMLARGFGLTFLIINLYTRFFEHFWEELHAAVFFGLLGISLWALGHYAQRM